MIQLRYILLCLLCIPLSLKSQSYVKSIEHGVYIDHAITYPYTQLGVTTTHGLFLELGMLDIPTEVNLRVNNTVQNRAGSLSYLINNIKEPLGYRGSPRFKELYYSIGYSSQIKKYRYVIQCGYSYNNSMIKLSQFYRVIENGPAYVDLGLHLQLGMRRQFLFFGYSWGVDLN